ncbi:hypothetical protein BCV69DRAFT_60218 [Microstroma glucosiphilum]|uniref:Uncharacterized protein n=1 Tax=Pseudomicrostroma glucosiphilum TaxID=1684307 RepID=A0A316U2J2_9BASI|nr:hypothetical protein BCV69DRAFT_60218 [Pseudomicrostroma glucosiphilum]PWN18701.1 hypothetical protein BCV69DRAFT_60218 [Pseudomicrostroma glucosiphilum]
MWGGAWRKSADIQVMLTGELACSSTSDRCSISLLGGSSLQHFISSVFSSAARSASCLASVGQSVSPASATRATDLGYSDAARRLGELVVTADWRLSRERVSADCDLDLMLRPLSPLSIGERSNAPGTTDDSGFLRMNSKLLNRWPLTCGCTQWSQETRKPERRLAAWAS